MHYATDAKEIAQYYELYDAPDPTLSMGEWDAGWVVPRLGIVLTKTSGA